MIAVDGHVRSAWSSSLHSNGTYISVQCGYKQQNQLNSGSCTFPFRHHHKPANKPASRSTSLRYSNRRTYELTDKVETLGPLRPRMTLRLYPVRFQVVLQDLDVAAFLAQTIPEIFAAVADHRLPGYRTKNAFI